MSTPPPPSLNSTVASALNTSPTPATPVASAMKTTMPTPPAVHATTPAASTKGGKRRRHKRGCMCKKCARNRSRKGGDSAQSAEMTMSPSDVAQANGMTSSMTMSQSDLQNADGMSVSDAKTGGRRRKSKATRRKSRKNKRRSSRRRH